MTQPMGEKSDKKGENRERGKLPWYIIDAADRVSLTLRTPS